VSVCVGAQFSYLFLDRKRKKIALEVGTTIFAVLVLSFGGGVASLLPLPTSSALHTTKQYKLGINH
jgi:hypothetical protein